ncbi:hypothetical protein EMIT0P74_70322 [Pseudomonas sp. IT-P74]
MGVGIALQGWRKWTRQLQVSSCKPQKRAKQLSLLDMPAIPSQTEIPCRSEPARDGILSVNIALTDPP